MLTAVMSMLTSHQHADSITSPYMLQFQSYIPPQSDPSAPPAEIHIELNMNRRREEEMDARGSERKHTMNQQQYGVNPTLLPIMHLDSTFAAQSSLPFSRSQFNTSQLAPPQHDEDIELTLARLEANEKEFATMFSSSSMRQMPLPVTNFEAREDDFDDTLRRSAASTRHRSSPLHTRPPTFTVTTSEPQLDIESVLQRARSQIVSVPMFDIPSLPSPSFVTSASQLPSFLPNTQQTNFSSFSSTTSSFRSSPSPSPTRQRAANPFGPHSASTSRQSPNRAAAAAMHSSMPFAAATSSSSSMSASFIASSPSPPLARPLLTAAPTTAASLSSFLNRASASNDDIASKMNDIAWHFRNTRLLREEEQKQHNEDQQLSKRVQRKHFPLWDQTRASEARLERTLRDIDDTVSRTSRQHDSPFQFSSTTSGVSYFDQSISSNDDDQTVRSTNSAANFAVSRSDLLPLAPLPNNNVSSSATDEKKSDSEPPDAPLTTPPAVTTADASTDPIFATPVLVDMGTQSPSRTATPVIEYDVSEEESVVVEKSDEQEEIEAEEVKAEELVSSEATPLPIIPAASPSLPQPLLSAPLMTQQHLHQSYETSLLRIGDLPPSVTERDLFEIFNPIGLGVASIRVCRRSRDDVLEYAYVSFHLVEDARSAYEKMNYRHIHARPCRITYAQWNQLMIDPGFNAVQASPRQLEDPSPQVHYLYDEQQESVDSPVDEILQKEEEKYQSLQESETSSIDDEIPSFRDSPDVSPPLIETPRDELDQKYPIFHPSSSTSTRFQSRSISPTPGVASSHPTSSFISNALILPPRALTPPPIASIPPIMTYATSILLVKQNTTTTTPETESKLSSDKSVAVNEESRVKVSTFTQTPSKPRKHEAATHPQPRPRFLQPQQQQQQQTNSTHQQKQQQDHSRHSRAQSMVGTSALIYPISGDEDIEEKKTQAGMQPQTTNPCASLRLIRSLIRSRTFDSSSNSSHSYLPLPRQPIYLTRTQMIQSNAAASSAPFFSPPRSRTNSSSATSPYRSPPFKQSKYSSPQ